MGHRMSTARWAGEALEGLGVHVFEELGEVGVVGGGDLEAEALEEGLSEGAGGEGGLAGGEEGDGSGGLEGTADHDAAIGAVGAAGEVGDAEGVAGGAHDRFGGSHAVDETPDFELRFEFVGDEIEDEVGVADGVFDGGDEVDAVAEGGEGFFGVAESGGHHVFERDVEAC